MEESMKRVQYTFKSRSTCSLFTRSCCIVSTRNYWSRSLSKILLLVDWRERREFPRVGFFSASLKKAKFMLRVILPIVLEISINENNIHVCMSVQYHRFLLCNYSKWYRSSKLSLCENFCFWSVVFCLYIVVDTFWSMLLPSNLTLVQRFFLVRPVQHINFL